MEYRPETANFFSRGHGSLVAHEGGLAKTYGLMNAQERGAIFINPTDEVYKGQVIGRNSRDEDISVNVCKEKHLTNMRSKGEDVAAHMNAPMKMDLEDALEYIDDSELVEVTPKNIRIRKIILDQMEERRKRVRERN